MKNLAGIVFAFLLLWAGTASALTISSVTGDWTGTLGGTGVVEDTIGGSGIVNDEVRILWGTPDTEAGKSGLGFIGIAPPGFDIDIDVPFNLGTLKHYNNPIYSAASKAYLDIFLSFDDPAGLSSNFSFVFDIDETPNDITNSSPYSDDFIDFPDAYASQVFEVDGMEYTLQLLGFGDESGNYIDQFQSPELDINDTQLWGQITAAPAVPVPGTLLLLGSGLAGLVGLRRKK